MTGTDDTAAVTGEDDLVTQQTPVFTLGAGEAGELVLTIVGPGDGPAPDLLGAASPATLRAKLTPEGSGTFTWTVVSGPAVLNSAVGPEVSLSRTEAAEEGQTVTVHCSFTRGALPSDPAPGTGDPQEPDAQEPDPPATGASDPSEPAPMDEETAGADATATHELTLGEVADALVEGIEIVPGGDATEFPETVVTGKSFTLRVDIDPAELTSRVSILWEIVQGNAQLVGKGLKVNQSFSFRSGPSGDPTPLVAENNYPTPGQRMSFTRQSGWWPAVWNGHAGFIGPGAKSRVEETTEPRSPEVEVTVGEGEDPLQVRCTVTQHGQEIAAGLSPEFPVHQQTLTLAHGDQAPPGAILVGEEVTLRAELNPEQVGHWEEPTLAEGAGKVSLEVVPPAGVGDRALTFKVKGVAPCAGTEEKAVVEVTFNSDASGVPSTKRVELSVSALQWVTPPPETLMLNGTAPIKAACAPVPVPGDYTWELTSVAETPAGTYAGPSSGQAYPPGETVLVGLAECPPDSLTFDCVLTTAATGYLGRLQRVLSVAGLVIQEANEGEPRDPPSSVNPGESLTLIAQAADAVQDDAFSWEVEVQGEGERLTPTAAVGKQVTFQASGPSVEERDVTIRCTQTTAAGEVTGEHRLSVIGIRIDEVEEAEGAEGPMAAAPQGAPEVEPGVTLLRYGGTRDLEVVLTPALFEATPQWTAEPDQVVMELVLPSMNRYRASMPQPAEGEVQLTCQLTSPDTGRVYTATRPLHLWSETPVDPPWVTKAREELGVSGNGISNPRIKEYFDTTTYEVPNGNDITTTTSWCSAFVNWCLEESGAWPRTNSAMAVSWAKTWPEGVNLGPDDPRHGAIVVYWKHQAKEECPNSCSSKDYWDNPPNWMYGPECFKGHVGFCVGKRGDHTVILGGNQNHAVNLRAYIPDDRIIGYVFPPTYSIPANAANLQEIPDAPIRSLTET